MRRTKEEWVDIVRSFSASGMNVHRYCLAEGLGEQSLRNWVKRINGTSKQAIHYPAVGFVEILPGREHTVRPTAKAGPSLPTTDGCGLVVRFPGGISIDVQPGTDMTTLELVLGLMGKR